MSGRRQPQVQRIPDSPFELMLQLIYTIVLCRAPRIYECLVAPVWQAATFKFDSSNINPAQSSFWQPHLMSATSQQPAASYIWHPQF